MNGSEKQIAWATQIKTDMLDQIAISRRETLFSDPENERQLRGLSMIQTMIESQESAKWFIDNRGRNFAINWPRQIEEEVYGK